MIQGSATYNRNQIMRPDRKMQWAPSTIRGADFTPAVPEISGSRNGSPPALRLVLRHKTIWIPWRATWPLERSVGANLVWAGSPPLFTRQRP